MLIKAGLFQAPYRKIRLRRQYFFLVPIIIKKRGRLLLLHLQPVKTSQFKILKANIFDTHIILIETDCSAPQELSTHLKSSRTPIYKLNGSLGLDCCNGCIHILWNHITTVQQTTGHIFTMTWVTFHHLIGWFKAGIGDFSNTQLFMISFLC